MLFFRFVPNHLTYYHRSSLETFRNKINTYANKIKYKFSIYYALKKNTLEIDFRQSPSD